MVRRLSVLLVVAAFAAVLTGCGGKVRSKVEQGVAQSLPEIIGPADSYTVQAHGPSTRLMRGRLDRLDITGINVRLPNKITVSRLDVSIEDLEVDTGTREIEKAGVTRYAAVLTEAELTRYLAGKYPAIPGLSVTLRDRNISVLANPGISVIRIAVQGSADLVVREHRILALDLKKLRVAGIGVPDFAREFIQGQVGTIFDARDLGFEATIDSALIDQGTLTLVGGLDLMKALEKKRKAAAPRG